MKTIRIITAAILPLLFIWGLPGCGDNNTHERHYQENTISTDPNAGQEGDHRTGTQPGVEEHRSDPQPVVQ